MIREKGIALLLTVAAAATPVFGQPPAAAPPRSVLPQTTPNQFDRSRSQLFSPQMNFGAEYPGRKGRRRIRDFSRIFIERPQPREVKVHDIITIVVNEKSEVTLNSRFNRQRQASLKAELKEFMRIGKTGNLATAK